MSLLGNGLNPAVTFCTLIENDHLETGVTNNSPSQDSSHPHDHLKSTNAPIIATTRNLRLQF